MDQEVSMSDAVISRIHQTLTRPVSYDHDAGKLGINEKELGQINNTFEAILVAAVKADLKTFQASFSAEYGYNPEKAIVSDPARAQKVMGALRNYLQKNDVVLFEPVWADSDAGVRQVQYKFGDVANDDKRGDITFSHTDRGWKISSIGGDELTRGRLGSFLRAYWPGS
jgi:hypothetical protein